MRHESESSSATDGRRTTPGARISRRVTAVGALVLLFTSSSATSREGAEMVHTIENDAEEREVLDVIEAFNEAFADNDPERYFQFIDEEISVLSPSNPYRVEGIEDDREEFEWGIETGRTRVGYFQEMQPRVQRYGDVAVVTYFSRGAYGPEGEQTVAFLKETDVLVRRDDGWKIVHIHVSATR